MPRLPVVSGQEVIKALSKAGFKVEGQRGSHVKMKKHAGNHVIVTIVPLHRVLDVGTLIGIMKQAEISREQLFELLK